MFELNPGLMIWTTVSFVLLVALLYRVALPPLLAFLESREKLIADSLVQAAESQKKAEQLLEEHREKIAELHLTADRVIAEAKNEGLKVKKEIIERANQQSGLILERAKQDLVREKGKVLGELKKEFSEMVTGAAGKILRREVKPEDEMEIIEEGLRGIRM
jgi:F-type H+-transporting ATPase subunit b